MKPPTRDRPGRPRRTRASEQGGDERRTKGIAREIVSETGRIRSSGPTPPEMVDDAEMRTCIPSPLPQESSIALLGEVLDDRRGCVHDRPAGGEQAQTDLHVLSMIPGWIESTDGHEGLSEEHGTRPVRQRRSA